MATAHIPPPRTPPAVSPSDSAAPILLVQLQDDLTRSHLREALWVSVVIHLLVVIAIAMAPKWLPPQKIYVASNADLLRDKEVTFLEAPPDQQKVTKRPDTNIISDKDRIATTRKTPTIDRETLRRLLDARRPGPPGAPGLNTPPAPPPVVAQGPAPNQQPQPRPASPSGSPPEQGQTARLESPPLVRSAPGAFGSGLSSPGSAIARAAQETATSRGGGGVGGEFGLGTGASQGKVRSDIDIVSDTMGVDFGPYLARVLQNVRTNWYHLIPEVARAPLMKRGRVSIQFAIMKDGRVAGMQLLAPSGDVSLDRAAWGGITASDPFPPLPREFGGQYLALRFHFYYNPDSKDLQ